MESGGHKSGGGGGAAGGEGACSGGHLCHLCGYQYPNAHPSAKQRRAHRKNCGNPPSAGAPAAVGVEERDGKELPRGDDGGGAGGGGEGDGASAADCGGGLPGSAREVGNVVDDEDNAEHSSPKVSEAQVILNKSTEDCVVSGGNVPSGNNIKANGTDNDEIQTEVDMRSENVPDLEDQLPYQPAVSADHSLLSPEHGDVAGLSSEFSVDEINKSNVMCVETGVDASTISAQTNAIVDCLNDFSVTESDGTFDNIGKESANEDNEDSFLCQQNPETKIEQEKRVEEISSINNSNVFNNSVEHVSVSAVKESVNLLGDNVSCIEKHVCADNTDGTLASGNGHSEAPGIVKPQQQADSVSVVLDQLIIHKEKDIDEGLHSPDADVDTQALSSAVGHAVGAEDISAVNHTKDICSPHVTMEDGIQYNVRQTSDITSMPSQVDLTEISTYSACHEINMVNSKDDIDERSPNANLTSHEGHGIDVEEIPQNEVPGINVEEIQQNEHIIAYTASQESNAVCGVCDFGDNMPNEENLAEASSDKITTIQSTSNVEEKENIEEFNGYPACNNINEISNRDSVEETKQSEAYVETAHEINMASSIENVEEKEQIEEFNDNPACNNINVISSRDTVEETKQSEVYLETAHERNVASGIENVEEKHKDKEITADPSLEINAANLPSSLELSNHDVETTTDHTANQIDTVNVAKNVEEKKQNEEITIDPTSDIMICSTANDEKKQNEEITIDPTSDIMICSPSNDEKKQNEEMSAGPNSDKTIVPHGKFNVEDKSEETMPDLTFDKIRTVSNTDRVEDKNPNGELTSGTTYQEDSVIRIHTTDNVEEKKNEELASDSTSYNIDVESNADNVEEKRQNEDISADPSSHESNTPQTIGAENKKRDEEVAAEAAPNKIDVAQSTDNAEERKQEETVSPDEPRGDDQNEEITDKEVIVNSEKSHVSLKALLSEKGAETKEKKTSAKDRVLSFRRLVSKDGASPAKPGSPKAISMQQDWNSPARLPVEKKPKGKKQQWVPFICCPSMN